MSFVVLIMGNSESNHLGAGLTRALGAGLTRARLRDDSNNIQEEEVFERSRSKSLPLEQTRSKLANPVELTGFDRVSCDFDRVC